MADFDAAPYLRRLPRPATASPAHFLRRIERPPAPPPGTMARRASAEPAPLAAPVPPTFAQAVRASHGMSRQQKEKWLRASGEFEEST
jgi:hypothetical protein